MKEAMINVETNVRAYFSVHPGEYCTLWLKEGQAELRVLEDGTVELFYDGPISVKPWNEYPDA